MPAFSIYGRALFLVQLSCLCVSVTPHDYQPPGFKEADGDTMVFEKEPVRLTMGEVVTPYHTLKLDMTTERQRLEQVNDNSILEILVLKSPKLITYICEVLISTNI